LQAIGRIEDLPAAARVELEATIARTAHCTGLRVNLALNYSGRADLVDAVNRLLRSGAGSVSEEQLSRALSTGSLPDPDLLIRTSGEMRVSNFLLWQIAYSEIYVTGTLWPDFRQADLLRAILDYQQRDRRFGGLSQADRTGPVRVEVASTEEIAAR
jgi:undecaprenyl diphosphate synthase